MDEDKTASGYAQHMAEQRRAWLSLPYAERLRWLEQAKAFAERAVAAARSRETPPKPAPGE